MKTLKKNNKGFSLVELIVVILIMAIIAVALAPQVMKWVDESKVSADNSNKATIKSAVDAAVADYMHEQKQSKIAVDGYKITENKLEVTTDDFSSFANASTANTSLDYYVALTMNNQFPAVEQDGNGYFKVVITETGAVTVTVCNASGTEISGD